MSRTHRSLLRDVNVKRRRLRLLRRNASFAMVFNQFLSLRRFFRKQFSRPSFTDALFPAVVSIRPLTPEEIAEHEADLANVPEIDMEMTSKVDE